MLENCVRIILFNAGSCVNSYGAFKKLCYASNKYVSFTDEYLEKNYEYDVRIADIASELGIHPSYLQMIYKQKKKLHNNLLSAKNTHQQGHGATEKQGYESARHSQRSRNFLSAVSAKAIFQAHGH